MDTVLIVDDSSFIVEGLNAFLKKRYRTLAAYGGDECLAVLAREIPSVIILDIMMEPMDGWETLARIKENPRTRHIPVLMFSAKKISPEEAEEHRVRIDDFITKPVSPATIIDAIEKVLARRNENRKMVECWRSAGALQDKIDEYLSLVNSLEVDLSLCQNMRIQADLAHDRNREDLQAVILAIEERIRQERALIDALARELNAAHGAGRSLPDAGEERDLPRSGESAGGDEPGGAATGMAAPPGAGEPPVSGPATAAPGNADGDRGTTVPDAGITAGLSAPGPRDAVVPPAGIPAWQSDGLSGPPAGSPEEQGLVSPGVSTGPASPGEDYAVAGGIASAGGLRAGAGEPRSVPPGEESGETVPEETVPGETGPGDMRKAPGPRVHSPSHESTEPMERRVIPANPDIPPASPGPSATAGAGTDVPMPWDTRTHKGKTGISAPGEVRKSPGTGSALPPQGFFSRILSLVRSLFGRTS